MSKDFDCVICERIFEWEWWKSSVTGRRSIFAPGTIPRCKDEWFKERADGTEALVGDWNIVHIPAYSSNIQEAWKVVEWLRGSGWLVTVKEMPEGFPFLGDPRDDPEFQLKVRSVCELMFMPHSKPEEASKRIYVRPMGAGDCAAMAICRAAINMLDLTRDRR